MRSKHPEALKLSEKIKIMKPKMAGALLQGLKPWRGGEDCRCLQHVPRKEG